MVTKVGINGFGRVGRIVFRTCFQHPDIAITAINDPAVDIEYICYLIKFDSTHGKLPADVSHKGSEIKIDDRIIKVYHHKLPGNIPWIEAGAQYVVEASGMFSTLEKASGHLTNDGVKRVMLTAPSVDIPMHVLGVNDDLITADMKVLSCGSSTLYCLAPIMKVLVDRFGVEDGFVTSIHAMTPSLKPLDGLCLRGKHWREHRSITQNIIPATTGACKALSKIIPQVKDKLTGLAFRVPIANVSVLDVTVRLSNDTTLEAIVQEVDKASQSAMLNIIKTSNEENVSSDFIGDIHSCILDANSSLQLKPNYFKLICWYENEYSYACRIVDAILFSEKQFSQSNIPLGKTVTTYVRTKTFKKQDMLQQTDFCIKETQPKPEREFVENKSLNLSPKALTLRKALENTKMSDGRTFQNNEGVFTICRDDTKHISKTSKNSNSSNKPVVLQPSKRQVDCTKAQERLEKVKKEFYKMVDMTEGLLKKTNSTKYTGCTVVKDVNQHEKNSAHDATDTERASIKTLTNESSCSHNSLNIEKKQLPGNVHVRGDCFVNSKDSNSNKTLLDLSKEKIVNSIIYDRESAYSVKEMKKFFDNNTQHFLHLRYCERSPEKDVKTVSAEGSFNKPEINILNSVTVNEQKFDQKLDQSTTNNLVLPKKIDPIKPKDVDLKPESPLLDMRDVEEKHDKHVQGDYYDKDVGKHSKENHPSGLPKRSIIVDDQKSEGIHIQTQKDKQLFESEISLQSTGNTESRSKAPIIIDIPSRKIRETSVDKNVTLTLMPRETECRQIENKMPGISNSSSTSTSEIIKTEDHVPVIRNSKNIVSKTLSSLLDGLSKNFQFQSFPGKEKPNTNTIKDYTANSATEKSDVNDLKMIELSAVVDNLNTLRNIEREISGDDQKLRTEKSNVKNIFLGVNFRNIKSANSRGDTKPQNHSTVKDKYSPCSSSESLRKSFSKNENKNDKSKVPLIDNVIREVPNEDEDIKLNIKTFDSSQPETPENKTESQIKLENGNATHIKVETILHRDELCEGDGNQNKLVTKENPKVPDRVETEIAMDCSSQSSYKFEPTKFRQNQHVYVTDKLKITSSIETLGEELKKRNIKLVQDTKKNQEIELRAAKVEDYLKEVETFNRCVNLVKRPTSSRCSSPLSSYAERVYKEDIYDKLDSTSASDSEISVNLGGRKSQVINIKDLTSSLDDLERLDKICRIIEISDELSDKLFSNLDAETDKSNAITTKKWSFKDLCEKIKLDEFCDNVFGQ